MTIYVTRRWNEKSEKYKNKAIEFYEEGNQARHRSLGEPLLPCPYDFSKKAALEMFIFESTGKGNIAMDVFKGTVNGYAIGKKWLDVEINRKGMN